MALYLYRRGNGNEGNYPRFCVDIPADVCPFAALAAVVVSERIPGSRTRRHIMREIQTDGEPEFSISAWVHDGPDGETDFGAAWLTAEFQGPMTDAEYDRCVNINRLTLREAIDSAAWRHYRKEIQK